MKPTLAALAVLPLVAAAEPAVDSVKPVPLLLDPNSFSGFRQLGGKAKYEVRDGMVTGTSVAKEPNSFMATAREFGDFVLEYEFKVDERLNSGVQFRSHSDPGRQKGRVHGYQCEIDPSDRAWSAGIYDEARRGWLDDLADNKPAGAAFRHDDWNAVRIEAVGDRMRTWINGVAAADLRDAMDQTGFIALQVHGVGTDAAKIGTQVQWRNLTIQDLGRHEWKPIFDGKSLDGWSAAPGGRWEVREGAIRGTSPASEARHGMLLHQHPHGDFTARFKFRVNKGNSGFYFRSEQVDGSESVRGFQAEVCDTTDTGGLYETGGRGWVSQPDKAQMEKDGTYRPGEWNEMWVSAHGNRLVVHVNGRRTADVIDDKQVRSTGLIGLQLHGGQEMDVEFKELALLVPAGTSR